MRHGDKIQALSVLIKLKFFSDIFFLSISREQIVLSNNV